VNPPWLTFWNKLKATLGADCSVTVDPLDVSGSPYVARITVPDPAQAAATVALLNPQHAFGNVVVVVEVRDGLGLVVTATGPGSAEELSEWVRVAFRNNGWYRDVVIKDLLGHRRVYPVFAKSVVQFFNDDLSELHSNFNVAAASVFANVLEHAPGGFPLLCSTDTK